MSVTIFAYTSGVIALCIDPNECRVLREKGAMALADFEDEDAARLVISEFAHLGPNEKYRLNAARMKPYLSLGDLYAVKAAIVLHGVK